MSWVIDRNGSLKETENECTREKNSTTIETDIQKAIPIWDLLKISKEKYDENYSANAAISTDAVDKQDSDKDNP